VSDGDCALVYIYIWALCCGLGNCKLHQVYSNWFWRSKLIESKSVGK